MVRKNRIEQESMPQGLKAHDDYIAFAPGINPRRTLKYFSAASLAFPTEPWPDTTRAGNGVDAENTVLRIHRFGGQCP